MTVKELKESLVGIADDANVVFQANEPGEDDGPNEYTRTFAVGPVFSCFERGFNSLNDVKREFVIDGAATARE